MLIGITGLINSGKGSTASVLKDIGGFTSIAFADSLKDVVSAIFGWPRHLLEGDTQESRLFRIIPDEYWAKKLNRHSFTPRDALVEIGTNVIREHFDINVWVNVLEKKIQLLKQENIVVHDVRFKNELDMIRNNKGKIIRLERGPRPDYWEDAVRYNKGEIEKPKSLTRVSQSEWDWIGVDNPDYIIINNGSLDDLRKYVITAYNDLKKLDK